MYQTPIENSAQPPYRSHEAQKLHGLICHCCLDAHTMADIAQDIGYIGNYLQYTASHPAYLLEKAGKTGGYTDTHGRSHLMDVLYLPFAPDRQCSDGLRACKAETLFRTLTQAIHKAIDNGKIRPEDYSYFLTEPANNGITLLHHAAQSDLGPARLVFDEARKHVKPTIYAKLLTRKTDSGYSLLHEAICSKNVPLARFIFDEVRKHVDPASYAELLTTCTSDSTEFSLLHCTVMTGDSEMVRLVFDEVRKHVTPTSYATLLFTPTKMDFTILHLAAQSGNNEMVRMVFDEVERYVPKDVYRDLLTLPTENQWNLFHYALMCDEQMAPDRCIIERIIDGFNFAFDKKEDAKNTIRDLCAAENDKGFPAFPQNRDMDKAHQRPAWLRDLMSSKGVLPTPRLR